MCLADACGAEEHEHADGLVGVLESETVTLDGLDNLVDGGILADYGTLEGLGHVEQTRTFGLRDADGRDARHHGHDLGDFLLADRLAFRFELLLPVGLGSLEVLPQLGFLVALLGGEVILLLAGRLQLLLVGCLYFLFELLYLLRHTDIGDMHSRTGLVKSVERLVGESTVAHVPFREVYAGLQGIVAVADVMVFLVLAFYLAKNLQGLFGSGGLHHHFLETAFECAVFFDVLAVFVEGCGADALYVASCQGRLEHVGGVHGAWSRAGADDGV